MVTATHIFIYNVYFEKMAFSWKKKRKTKTPNLGLKEYRLENYFLKDRMKK